MHRRNGVKNVFCRALAVLMCLSESVLPNIEIRRGGWLDRVVSYHKARFIKDVKELVPINVQASIVPTPQGYQDSKKWDFESVIHLLVLIKGTHASAQVHRVLRRQMQPTRRLMMSMAESFKHFPSLSKLSLNEFYYDVGSPEDYEEEEVKSDEDGVIVVSNPVEARLPSSQISVKLLKDILVQRAIAGRAMPSTTRSPIPWKPMNKTASEDAEGDATTVGHADGSASGNGTSGGDGDGAKDANDGATASGTGDDKATTAANAAAEPEDGAAAEPEDGAAAEPETNPEPEE